MLVINYNGNKPTTDYFKFSVQGNNNADVVRFCLSKQQNKNDLSSCKVYAQAYCEEDGFIDKVEITDNMSIVGNQLSVDWTLLKKHTVNRQLQVSLSFEDTVNEIVWQTQIVKINIANGINADEEMINSYPSVIQQMRDDIDNDKVRIGTLEEDVNDLQTTKKDKYDKNFMDIVMWQKGYEKRFKSKVDNVSIGITVAGQRSANHTRQVAFGTKLGTRSNTPSWSNILDSNNDISSTDLLKLFFSDVQNQVVDFVSASRLFDNLGQLKKAGYTTSKPNQMIFYSDTCYYATTESDTGHIVVNILNGVIKDSTLDHQITRCLRKVIFGKSTKDENDNRVHYTYDVAHTRFMVKFIQDYTQHSTDKNMMYWTGNMAKLWLEVDVAVYDVNTTNKTFKMAFRIVPRSF